jgi:hypothetical protein
MNGPTPNAPVVIVIAGVGRSGSTLLERLLLERSAAVGVGELRYVWERGLLNDQLCGCGRAFSACPFWSEVSNAADLRNAADRAVPLVTTLNRTRRLAWMRWPKLANATRQEAQARYVELFEPLYRAIGEVAGSDLVIDTSKIPTHVVTLARGLSLPIVVVHLIRDSRAVTHSWQRKRPRPEIPSSDEEMDRPSPLNVAMTWDVQNAALRATGRTDDRFVVIRYEDLVADPTTTVDLLLDEARRRGATAAARHDQDLRGRWHSVSGNPHRFDTAPRAVKADHEWVQAMPARQRRLVTIATLPGLKRYNYPIRPG